MDCKADIVSTPLKFFSCWDHHSTHGAKAQGPKNGRSGLLILPHGILLLHRDFRRLNAGRRGANPLGFRAPDALASPSFVNQTKKSSVTESCAGSEHR
jgi:hypothetical protein